MRGLEHRIPPPLVALLVGLVMWAMKRALAPLEVASETRLTLATAVAACGVAIAVAGVAAFRSAGASIDPHRIDKGEALVTDGVYRFSRNPMYLGLATMLLGYALAMGPLIELLGPCVFVLFITRFQILPEERVMAAKFGAAFADYRSRVRRWL